MQAISTAALLLGGGLLAGPAQAQQAMFAAAVQYATGAPARTLAMADVNGDGRLDVLTANTASNTAAVLLGNGNGTFQAATTVSTGSGSNPYDVAVADVNQDGRPDLLVANYGTNSAGVLLGNGNGTFQPAVAYATGTANGRPTGIAVADLTGDGRPDLLTANSTGYTFSLFAGTGTGAFQAPTNYTISSTSAPLDVAIADMNSDGRPDALISSAGSNTVALLVSVGGNGFQPGPYLVGPGAGYLPYAVTAGDVNNDGRPDVITANSGNGSTVSALLNGGNYLGAATLFYNAGAGEALSVAVADVNGDGKADVLTPNPGNLAVNVLLGSGTGSFQQPDQYSVGPAAEPHGLAVADLNGDGRPDAITANYGTGTISVLLNTTVLATRATLPGTSASLAPNPATAHTTLTLAGLPASVTTVQATVLDATGRAVGQHRLAAAQGRAQAEVPTAGLAAGLYLVRLAALDAQGASVGALPVQRLSVE